MPQYTGGTEFRVNTDETYEKYHPAVAALSDGGFVVTWVSYGQDGDGYGVYAQRYDASGAKIGQEVRVSTSTYDDQSQPDVVGLKDGGYVVTWSSKHPYLENVNRFYDIYAQRFDASGARVGGEEKVNTYTSDYQHLPHISALAGGGYVITWTSWGHDGSDVFAQRYDATGAKVGAEVQVNSYSTYSQSATSVEALSDGGYVVTWTSWEQDGNNDGVFMRRYDASGSAVIDEVQVNTFTWDRQFGAQVTELADGGYVVTWESSPRWPSPGQDGSGGGVYAQRYDASGTAVGSEVQVNTHTDGDQTSPTITALPDGGYVIVWESYGQNVNQGAYAQRFDASGAKIGGEQLLNPNLKTAAQYPTITTLADGSFVVAWTFYDAGGWYAEGTGPGVFARKFTFASSTEGDSGNNLLAGTTRDDTINGYAGDDLLEGLTGNDILAGGEGKDQLFGGAGDDILSANGSITFDNGTTVDQLYGGSGNDMIFAGFGDIVDGGDGFDTVGLSYVGASSGITGDTAILHKGQPLVPGGGTFQSIERFSDIAMTEFDDKMVIGDQHDPATVRAWNGNDHLIGQEVSVTMYGGNGHDLLVGSTSFDVLYGESGDDILIGGTGMDELWGGTGSDRFLFTHTTGLPDTIGDFQTGIDKIDFSDIDADVSAAGNQAFNFIGSANFSNRAGELRVFNAAGTGNIVEVDVNGDGSTDLSIILGSAQVVNSDFLL